MEKKSLLFVDDEPEILENYRLYFEKSYEFIVITASDPNEALNKLERQKFHLICTDFRMPNTNGADFITEARSIKGNENVPCIIITGYIEEATKACEGIPNLLLLAKPVSLPSVAELARHIAKSGKIPALNQKRA